MSLTPYYDRDGITIYNADCRDVLPTLGRFDLLLTDPPYGLGDRMQGGTWGAKAKYGTMRSWDQVTPTLDMFDQMQAISGTQIIWGGNYFPLPASRGFLVWDKTNAVPTMASAELGWTSFDKPARTYRGPVGAHTTGHPTQKPLALFRWCLSLVPDATTVLDPYAGSCTTALACKLEGRSATCIEINEAYCESAVKRLEQGVLF